MGSRPRKASPQLVESKTSLGKRELLKKRTLDDPKIYDSESQYVMAQSKFFPVSSYQVCV